MKYGARKTECATGHVHDSKMEAARCDVLTAKQDAGEITHLIQQPEFPCIVDGRKICLYRGDFQYRMAGSGLPIVEDVKGVITADFSIKRKLVEALYAGVVITLYPPRVRKKRKSAKRKQAA